MDRIIYFLVVFLVVAYFFIPKVAGFDYPQIYWQYQLEKYRCFLNDFRAHGFRLNPDDKKSLPQNISSFYQKAILNQLQELEKIDFK